MREADRSEEAIEYDGAIVSAIAETSAHEDLAGLATPEGGGHSLDQWRRSWRLTPLNQTEPKRKSIFTG